MQIKDISAVLDSKLTQLEQQLKDLQLRLEQTQDAQEQARLAKDMAALIKVRGKLLKSKDLAWRAHELQQNPANQARARQRLIGLSLCGLSLICGGLLLSYLLLN